MSETKKIPLRAEVNPNYTWAIEDLYSTLEDWKADFQKALSASETLKKYRGKLASSADFLYEFLQYKDELELLVNRISQYAERKSDEDTTNSLYQDLCNQVQGMVTSLLSSLSFETPEILTISEEQLSSFYTQKPELRLYETYLFNIRRKKTHILTEAEEKLLASAGELAAMPDITYSLFNNADLTFPSITDQEGTVYPVTHGTFIPLLEHKNPAIRKAAFESLYHTYEKFKNTSSSLLFSEVKKLIFYAKARNYPSTLHASLDYTNVPTEVYFNLIDAVHENMEYMHRYIRLRKKLLSVDELHMYDLYTPIVSQIDISIPFEEAKKTVLEAVAPLGTEYQEILKTAFQNRWIDVYENVGKRSGAYSAGAQIHPYVLLNYKDSLDSQFTLAHEMGHALHSYLSNHTQPTVYSEYVIFLAEVASTCNEALLMEYLLAHTDNKMERAYLINYFLEQFRTTLYRQTMFAEFELKINQMAEKGESLTADALCSLYHDLNVTYYGKEIVVDHEIDIEWARIPHFYYNFYVFQYATGYSAAIALSKKILKEGTPAVQNYLKFLSSGCSQDPISLLKMAGVDMTTPEPITEALHLFGELIDELEQLLS